MQNLILRLNYKQIVETFFYSRYVRIPLRIRIRANRTFQIFFLLQSFNMGVKNAEFDTDTDFESVGKVAKK